MRLALVHELQAAIPACVVHAAATIATALELIEANQFALILIDPGLPGYDPRSEMDRLKTISTVVERTPAAIHIVITGAESAQEWEEVRTIGVAGYIAKNSLKPGTMTAILQSAYLEIGQGNLRTKDPVDIKLEGAQIVADAMSVLENGKVLIFEKRVKMNLTPARLKGKQAPSVESPTNDAQD